MIPRLHDFELLARLGSSTWANLFLARDRAAHPARLLALKVLRPSVATDASTLDVFFTEARIAARIKHPNVVTTTGFGQIEGVHCLSMEYVFGERLADLVDRLRAQGRPAPLGWALRIAVAVAEGLHAAHELRAEDGSLAGVVHRTINPRNIMLAFDGRVKVMDFGSVKARARGFETHHGTIKGSAGYLSPEQARGEPLDRRSDVFSLGVVLWELLIGRRLFPEDAPLAVLGERQQQPVAPIRQLEPDLPVALERIVARALARDREHRYGSAQDLAGDLRELLARAGLTPAEASADASADASIDASVDASFDASVGLQTRALVGDAVTERGRALHAAVQSQEVPDLAERLGAFALLDADIPVIPGGMTSDDPLRLFERDRSPVAPPRFLGLAEHDHEHEPAEIARAEHAALLAIDEPAGAEPAAPERRSRPPSMAQRAAQAVDRQLSRWGSFGALVAWVVVLAALSALLLVLVRSWT